jgi:hypothetical protein
MLLSQDDAKLFGELHHCLMHFVNQQTGIVPHVDRPEHFAVLPPEVRAKVNRVLPERLDLIDAFAAENPAGFSLEELDIVRSWRHLVTGRFYAFRQLKKYMVFLSAAETPVAYGVVALSEPFENLIGSHLPVMVSAVLLPVKDSIIYDGLLSSFNVTFGGGIRRGVNESYREAKDRQGIVTSLPAGNAGPATKPKPSKPRRKQTSTASGDVKPVLEAIVGQTDGFCREFLNDEYAELCRLLAEKLSRKRPSPLLKGRAVTWASGIIRTIGWVNFLQDRASEPSMPLKAIDEALGSSQKTGQNKSSEIRKMLRIQQLDPQWTLPSRMDDNPYVWMLDVNGFTIDARDAPRELQEVAFGKGLIPYIPADREEEEPNSGSKANPKMQVLQQHTETRQRNLPGL